MLIILQLLSCLFMSSQSRHQYFNQIVLETIHKKGFKAMTMRDLAMKMDCDVANIYNYTASKQALLRDNLFAMSRSFHDGVDEISSSELSAIEQVREVIGLFINLSYEEPLKVALLANEWRNLRGDDLKKFIAERQLFEKKVKKIVERGMREKALKKLNPDISTFLLLSSLRWIFDMVQGKKKPNRLSLEKEIASFLMDGLVL